MAKAIMTTVLLMLVATMMTSVLTLWYLWLTGIKIVRTHAVLLALFESILRSDKLVWSLFSTLPNQAKK